MQIENMLISDFAARFKLIETEVANIDMDMLT